MGRAAKAARLFLLAGGRIGSVCIMSFQRKDVDDFIPNFINIAMFAVYAPRSFAGVLML